MHRAARFIISSRAKRACIIRGWQGQRDFLVLLAIDLSSLVGVRLDVIQSSDIKAHYGFPGNRFPSTTKFWVLFMKTRFSSVNYKNVYGRWITTQYLRQIKENSNSTTVHLTSCWNSSLGKIYKQNPARARTWLNSARATAQRRQTLLTRDRLYSDHEYLRGSNKYYSYAANEADEETEHRLPTFQQNAVNRIRNETEERQVYTKNYLLRCNDRKQESHHL